jgi:amino-acid N-acetyltransferase
VRIERALASDTPAVEALLAAAGLPLEGAAEALATGVVARDGEAVVGAAAVERYGEAGLLRSVVVTEPLRGTGLGRELVAAAEDLARDRGIRELYLLTETAARWFPRLGYAVVPREEARAAVGDSIEFTMVCATSGVPMRRALDDARPSSSPSAAPTGS